MTYEPIITYGGIVRDRRTRRSEITRSGPTMNQHNIAANTPPPSPVTRSHAPKAKAAYGLGSILAVTISWSVHHSILWTIMHAFASWLYVLAYWMGWAEQLPPRG